MRVTISRDRGDSYQEWHRGITFDYANAVYLHSDSWRLKAMLQANKRAKYGGWTITEVEES